MRGIYGGELRIFRTNLGGNIGVDRQRLCEAAQSQKNRWESIITMANMGCPELLLYTLIEDANDYSMEIVQTFCLDGEFTSL